MILSDGNPEGQYSRRDFVSLLAGIPLATRLNKLAEKAAANGFPAKNEFDIKGTYINAAYTHPMSKGCRNEINQFLNDRMLNRTNPSGYDAHERATVKANFAKLINAGADEIAFVPSTMVGENLVISGLSLRDSKNRIVTDAFHFHGSLHLYNQLAKEGLDTEVVRPRQKVIDLNDLDAAIKRGTRLVALSLVSSTTGYLHDLKQVCDLAHARGAYVYADIIQAAGAIPIDVKASGVDFCATATYKWLMGDFGVGFLYVRKDLLSEMKRTMFGYRQIASSSQHFLPFETPGRKPFESESKEDMSGHFEVGTFASGAIAPLHYSLPYFLSAGPEKIQQYRQPMIDYLQDELPNHGFLPLTPAHSPSPIVCFAYKDAEKLLKPKLDAADIDISVYEHMIRISPSIYNDMEDVKKLTATLRTK